MKNKMNSIQAIELLEQLQAMYGDELFVRIAMELDSQKTGDIIPELRKRGYRAHPEVSAYSEREIVVTSVEEES